MEVDSDPAYADNYRLISNDWPGRWNQVTRLLERGGPFAHPSFDPTPEMLLFLREACNILVVGAGGLGCELVKNLALMGFKNLHLGSIL
jgi:ubiquitin-activating enzyme E1 C